MKYWIILADAQLGAIHWQNLQREQDYYEAFQTQCLKAAADKDCLGILGLGDLRERATIQAKNLGGLNRGLQTLADANKPLLALMGNHDKTEPNWINEMCYPSLKDLTIPSIQEHYGFDPSNTLALHYCPKSEINTILSKTGKNKTLVFLHQSLKELTTHLLQSFDLSLQDLKTYGIGEKYPATIFLGDLHNYGDVQLDSIQAAYPGSLEMTDINEGINGLKSSKLVSGPHDYRKFVIHYYPELQNQPPNNWKPVEINPRPWFRGKGKSSKECDKLESLLTEHSKTWEKPACILLTVVASELQRFRDLVTKMDVLEARIQEYDPSIDDSEDDREQINLDYTLCWDENKKNLLDLAKSSEMDAQTYQLLETICKCDGSTHNPKNDVNSAWQDWVEQYHTNPNSPKVDGQYQQPTTNQAQ